MAAHKDDVDVDDVATEGELEEVLSVLAGSDPENCSYIRVSCVVSRCNIYQHLQLKVLPYAWDKNQAIKKKIKHLLKWREWMNEWM